MYAGGTMGCYVKTTQILRNQLYSKANLYIMWQSIDHYNITVSNNPVCQPTRIGADIKRYIMPRNGW